MTLTSKRITPIDFTTGCKSSYELDGICPFAPHRGGNAHAGAGPHRHTDNLEHRLQLENWIDKSIFDAMDQIDGRVEVIACLCHALEKHVNFEYADRLRSGRA